MPTPVLMYRNQSAIDTFTNRGTEVSPTLTEVVTTYAALNLGGGDAATLDTQGLKDMLYSADLGRLEKAVRLRMTKDVDFNLGGLTLSHERLSEMVELPDLSSLWEKVKAARQLVWSEYGMWGMPGIDSFIVTAGVVSLNPAEITKITEQNSIYATTDNEIALYNSLAEAADAINSSTVLGRYDFLPIPHTAEQESKFPYAGLHYQSPTAGFENRTIVVNARAIKGRVG